MTYLHQFKRDFFIWWGCKKLNRLIAKQRAQSEQYIKRREAAKAGWQRRRAM